MIVDLTQLTQDQTWGVQFRMQQLNAQIDAENKQAEAYNLTRPVNSPAREIRPLLTAQDVADQLATSGGFEAAVQQMRSYKQSLMVPAYLAATADVQAQVDTLLGVAPIIQ